MSINKTLDERGSRYGRFEDERIAHEVAAFLNRSQPGKG